MTKKKAQSDEKAALAEEIKQAQEREAKKITDYHNAFVAALEEKFLKISELRDQAPHLTHVCKLCLTVKGEYGETCGECPINMDKENSVCSKWVDIAHKIQTDIDRAFNFLSDLRGARV